MPTVGIGRRLKQFRESLGLSQRAFGQSLGLPGPETISRWERSLAYPSADILSFIRQLYRLNAEWLLSGEGDMQLSAGPRTSLAYIDPAVQLVDEAIQETGVQLNDRQKRALVEIIRDELRSRTVDMIRALKGGG